MELIVLNGKENEEDINKELAEDLIAIVTSFAARIYGQRDGKSMIVIQAKLIFSKPQDKQIVLDLMRRWSSCMRFAYKRLLEGYDRNTLKRDLQGTFNLNSRYADDAIMKARSTLESSKELGSNPKKVIFGGRKLFKKLQKRPYKRESI
ncbi:transposase [Thermoanaerobacter ethanolicus JW 200]|nr:transposase [Thermoanaerobacter ethanolicus JW 200]